MLLAIDTATHTASLALYDEASILGETTWRTHENHTRSLMPELLHLLELVGVTIADVHAIGVATGPGSFTGLRIGLSVAKGLAYSRNAALIGVPTLDITASAAARQGELTCAVIQAGRGRYGVAQYEPVGGAVQRVSPYLFGSAAEITAQLPATIRAFSLVGEVDAVLLDALRVPFGDRITFVNPALNLRRAGFLASLAWQRLSAGATDDIDALAPYYIPTASLA